MAPKKRTRTETGQSSTSHTQPNWVIHRSNTYLFRNAKAHHNYVGQFQARKLAQCFYFDKATVTFTPQEDAKLLEYIIHWNWENLLKCSEPYTELLTRTFYSNLLINENPFFLSTYICGKEIILSPETISQWIEIPNDGEETYILRGWPSHLQETADQYKTWFDRKNRGGASLYCSQLPALHRLIFLFINNILLPKASIKTNIEWGPMYLLRHLIQLDDKRFNMPYMILRHMRSTFESTVALLPYASLIHKIIRENGIELPEGTITIPPDHLVDLLTKQGWKYVNAPSGLYWYKPEPKSINRWIFKEGALPNQYWDPNEATEENAGQEDQAQIPSHAGNVPPGSTEYAWLVRQMTEHRAEVQKGFRDMTKEMNKGFLGLRTRFRKNEQSIKDLEDVVHDLNAQFVKQFGASSGSVPQSLNPDAMAVDEEEEQGNNEEEEDEEDAEDDENDE